MKLTALFVSQIKLSTNNFVYSGKTKHNFVFDKPVDYINQSKLQELTIPEDEHVPNVNEDQSLSDSNDGLEYEIQKNAEMQENEIFEVKVVSDDSEENVDESFSKQRPSQNLNPEYTHEAAPIREDEKDTWEYNSLGYKKYKKELDTTPDSSSKNSSQEYSQKAVKKSTELSSLEKRRSLLDESTDTIGDDADITVSYEDSPHCPATSVLKDATIFDKHGMNKKKISNDNKKSTYPKDYTNSVKSKDLRKSKLHKNKSMVCFDKKPFKSFDDHPTYLGYYFRELFRSTVKELHSQGKIRDVEEYVNDELHEPDVDLPEMTDKMIDDNKTHVTQSMQGLYYMNTVKSSDAYKHLKKTLPPTNKRKLAIFDMDETLIHWVPDKEPQSDTGSSGNKETDVMLKFKCSDGVDTLPVNIRPYIIECLLQVKKWYQVIVFTASKKNYADTILDFIDPNHDLIEARCYRDSCYTTEEHVYIKDLRIFEDQWDLKDIVLIDNAVHSFGFQINNGIPMLPFYDDKNDRDMIYVTHLLKELASQSDVRPMIRDRFWINKLKEPLIWEAIEGVIEYAIEEIEDSPTDLMEDEQQCKPEEMHIASRSKSAPRNSFRKPPTERITRTSRHKFNDEQISFDLHSNGGFRPTVTDLEITDDTDEREGDQINDLPNVAKYLRRIPWKPSNMNRVVPQTTTNSKNQSISL